MKDVDINHLGSCSLTGSPPVVREVSGKCPAFIKGVFVSGKGKNGGIGTGMCACAQADGVGEDVASWHYLQIARKRLK